jgi:hypothetical protein
LLVELHLVPLKDGNYLLEPTRHSNSAKNHLIQEVLSLRVSAYPKFQKHPWVLYTNAFQHTKNKGNLFSEVKVIGPLLAGLPLKVEVSESRFLALGDYLG